MTKTMDRIIHSALCVYREERAQAGQTWLNRAIAAPNGADAVAAFLVEACRCFRDSNAAHERLGCGFKNPCNAWDDDLCAIVLDHAEGMERANRYWAAQEAEIEAAAAADFEEQAYGAR